MENEFVSQLARRTKPVPPFGRSVLMARVFILCFPAGTTLHRSIAATGRRTGATFCFTAGPVLGLISGLCGSRRDYSAGALLNRFNSRLVPCRSLGEVFLQTGKRFLSTHGKDAANLYVTTLSRANSYHTSPVFPPEN